MAIPRPGVSSSSRLRHLETWLPTRVLLHHICISSSSSFGLREVVCGCELSWHRNLVLFVSTCLPQCSPGILGVRVPPLLDWMADGLRGSGEYFLWGTLSQIRRGKAVSPLDWGPVHGINGIVIKLCLKGFLE